MKQPYENIEKGIEIRQNLQELREACRDIEKKKQLQRLYEQKPKVLEQCLKAEDPKTRKNTALILGELTGEHIPELLWQAYEQEQQLFVKGDYVKALSGQEYRPYGERMKVRAAQIEAQLQQTAGTTALEGSEKHLRQELKELRKLLFEEEKPAMHAFAEKIPPSDVLLFTNRGHEKLTAGQITADMAKEVHVLKGAVLARQADVRELLSIRTFRELLFCLSGSKKLTREEGARSLLNSNLMELLGTILTGEAPYYFRLEVKGRMQLDEKSTFAKKFAAGLEELSGGRLKNAPSAYEVEIRLVENKDGTFHPLLKLQALPDKRFAYRKYSVAASVAPVQAAICMELAKDYFGEQAQVLDPFCGVGTMMLERNYKLHANTLYGVDLYGPAVKGAKENCAIAGVPAHFVNKDCREFTHGYAFDEIVTNFPVQGKSLDAHALDGLYGQFLNRAEKWLKDQGKIFLYSHDRGYVKKQLRMRSGWKLMEEWCISEKEGAWFFYIQRV